MNERKHKILFIDDDISILELFGVIIENMYGAESLDKAQGPIDAISFLEENHSQYSLIICDYDMPPQGTGEEVFNYIKKNKLNIPFVLFTSRTQDDIPFIKTIDSSGIHFHYINKITRPKDWQKIINDISLHSSKEDIIPYSPYKAIRFYHFMRHSMSHCDVFLKLTDKKYVKIINANEVYAISSIDKYFTKGITHLYIKNDDYDNFLDELSETPFLSRPHSSNDFLSAAQKNHEILGGMIKTLGITTYTFNLASNMSTQVLNEVSKDENLKALLDKIVRSHDYAYDHTFLITCFATAICNELNLDSGIIKKLSLLSLLHDIGISDAKLCKLHDLYPEELTHASTEQLSIIEQHHHLLDNVNFGNDIVSELSNVQKHHHLGHEHYPFASTFSIDRAHILMCIFLVSHSFVVEIYKSDFKNDDIPKILSKLKKTFSTSNFEKVLWALDRVTLIKKNT